MSKGDDWPRVRPQILLWLIILLLQTEWAASFCSSALLLPSSPLYLHFEVRKAWCAIRNGAAGQDPAAGEDSEAEARRAAYLRDREARERRLVPQQVDMEILFGDDKVPDYIERWGGMHRQVAMEGPTRMALEMAIDSEWASDSWTATSTPTNTETPSM